MATRRRYLTQSERVAESARRLMDAAIELIAEKGFEKTSAVEIAERAGYSHSMVAARYGSKEALLETLMREEYESLMLPPQDLPAGLPRLLAWIDHLRSVAQDSPVLFRAFCTLIFEAAGPVPSLRSWTEDWLSRCVSEAQASLEQAQKDGELPASLDARAEAEMFVFAGVGFGFRLVLDGNVDAYDGALLGWKDRLSPPARSARRRVRKASA